MSVQLLKKLSSVFLSDENKALAWKLNNNGILESTLVRLCNCDLIYLFLSMIFCLVFCRRNKSSVREVQVKVNCYETSRRDEVFLTFQNWKNLNIEVWRTTGWRENREACSSFGYAWNSARFMFFKLDIFLERFFLYFIILWSMQFNKKKVGKEKPI